MILAQVVHACMTDIIWEFNDMDISIRKNKEELYMNDKLCNNNMDYDDLIKENEALKMELHKLAEKFNKLAEENKELIEQLEWAYEEMSAR